MLSPGGRQTWDEFSIGEKNPDYVACGQQRRRPDCATAQSDQRLCY